jgi:hypothetical protein
MVEISFSIGELDKVVRSCVEAFDSLYTTLRRAAVDGWSGIGTVIHEINTYQDETSIRDFIVNLRHLQVRKTQIGTGLMVYMSESVRKRRNRPGLEQLWDGLENDLGEVLDLVAKQQYDLRNMRNIAVPLVLGEKFQEYVAGLSMRAQKVAHVVKRESITDQELNELIDLLDREAKLIGKCADILSEYIEHRRKELAGSR